jgi:hypothetical protein
MTELADIFRQHGTAYLTKFAERILPSHRQAMRAILNCRTEVLGGHVYHCDDCGEDRYSYHSCRNRHCPKCQYEAAEEWLNRKQEMLMPVPYFLLTFTLPAKLRDLVRRHQSLLYNLLFRTSAAATQQLARDPRFVGGQIGMIGILHTWGRNLHYHPHVHYLVPGGGLSDDGQHWLPSAEDFLVHVKPLSRLFRAKFCHALRKTPLFASVSPDIWKQEWVVHCKAVGNGLGALRYLAPYIFRVAISNNRILNLADGKVTFRYTDTNTKQTRCTTVAAEEFIRRFLQHVLPKGFVKIRYYGLFSPGLRQRLRQARRLLEADNIHLENPEQPSSTVATKPEGDHYCCPRCGQVMRTIKTIKPQRYRPP